MFCFNFNLKQLENNSKLIFFDFIKQSLKFLKPFKFLFILTILLNTLFSILSALSIALIKPIISYIFDLNNKNQSNSDYQNSVSNNLNTDLLSNLKDKFYKFINDLVYNQDIETTLYNLAYLIVGVFVAKNIVKYISSFTNVKLEEGIIKYIRDKLFNKLVSLPMEFYNKSKQGHILSVINNDVGILNSTTISVITNILRDLIQIIIFLFLLISISPYLTLIASSTSIVSLIIMKYSVSLLRKYSSRMQKAMSDFTTILQETISGIRVIKAFTSEKIILNKFEDQTKSYVKSAIKLNKINALVPAVNEIMAISALSIVLVVGGLGVVVYKNIQPDDLMTFLFSLFAIMTPITLVVNNINNFQRGIVSGERIFEILDADEKIISGKLLKVKFEKEIKFQNINFAYNVVNILKNINFEIFKGQRIALVGSSGSGKSTILDLLIRFYDTSSGELIVDGVNIKEYDLVSYRNLFGIVSQENLLFNDTIGNNIKFGNNDLSNEEMINICKLANCYNFINKLDNKFETIVGDKGVNLSGGERQRIAIARALAKNPEIIVFDEATSALDAESEKLVQEAMNHILDTRTSIVVAHRLSTIINSDVIFVFENGEIVEFGSHLELIKNNGVYKKLYEIQNINPN